MGTNERREREKQKRRDDILEAARTLFFDKGFRDTTIDDIARLTELARGTIYLYFDTKEEIYATVLEDGLDILLQLMKESYHDNADPLTNLLAGHDAYMRFHDEYPQYYLVMMLDKLQITDFLPAELKARLEEKFDQMSAWIAAVLKQGMEQGLFRPMPVRQVAIMQMGIATGFAQMLDKCAANSDAFKTRDEARQVMHDLIANGVLARSNR